MNPEPFNHAALEEERQYMARIASRVPYVTVDSNGTRYCTGCGCPIADRPHRNGYPCSKYAS